MELTLQQLSERLSIAIASTPDVTDEQAVALVYAYCHQMWPVHPHHRRKFMGLCRDWLANIIPGALNSELWDPDALDEASIGEDDEEEDP